MLNTMIQNKIQTDKKHSYFPSITINEAIKEKVNSESDFNKSKSSLQTEEEILPIKLISRLDRKWIKILQRMKQEESKGKERCKIQSDIQQSYFVNKDISLCKASRRSRSVTANPEQENPSKESPFKFYKVLKDGRQISQKFPTPLKESVRLNNSISMIRNQNRDTSFDSIKSDSNSRDKKLKAKRLNIKDRIIKNIHEAYKPTSKKPDLFKMLFV